MGFGVSNPKLTTFKTKRQQIAKRDRERGRERFGSKFSGSVRLDRNLDPPAFGFFNPFLSFVPVLV